MNNNHPIDYSSLRLQSKFSRWSPLATVVYAITLGAILMFVASLSHPLQLIALLISAGGVAGAGLWVSHLLFRRVNAAKLDDLWPFAADNNLQIISGQPPTDLRKHLHIQLRLSAIFKSYTPWMFDILLSLYGTYRDFPITLYSLIMAAGSASDSTIEQDAEYARYTQADNQATMTLTVSSVAWTAQHPGYGVVRWGIPGLSPLDATRLRKKLWRYSMIVDIQTDGQELAILLRANIPYDRAGMTNLFRLLDEISTLIPSRNP